MADLTLKEITVEEIQNHIEEYFNNHQQFFIKLRYMKGLNSAYLSRFANWNDDLEQIWSYNFEYDDGDFHNLEEDKSSFEHIYILK